jgi:uncharacterized protein YqeY
VSEANMLHQKIVDDLKAVLKSGDSFRTNTLRFLLSSLHNKEIEKKGRGLEPTLSDDEAIEVLSREAKKRKEASEAYKKGNRKDLAQKETKELEIIEKYLPEQLTEEEIKKTVKTAIEKVGAKEIKDFGRVMAETMKALKGKADASLVSEIVKSKLKIQN